MGEEKKLGLGSIVGRVVGGEVGGGFEVVVVVKSGFKINKSSFSNSGLASNSGLEDLPPTLGWWN